MTEYHIDLPISEDKIREIKAGDILFLSGIICTGRDHFHKRILSYFKSKKEFPNNFQTLKGGALYHMGPIMQKITDNRYRLISGGPTTSARMNPFQTEVCQILGIRIVIGKGGMDGVEWSNIPAIYVQYPGGAGALVSKFVKDVKGVEWIDLGTPEAAWFLDVKDFGPLVVGIDTKGGNLYKRKKSSDGSKLGDG